jgi:hypothetical protein
MEIIKAVAQGCTDGSDDHQGFSLDDSLTQDINADSKLEVDAEGYSILGNRNLYVSITFRTMNSTVKKLREVLKPLKYNPKLQSLLKGEPQDENEFRAIKLDVQTRWNSLYNMLSYALKFKQGIEAFVLKLAKKRYSDEIRTCLKYSDLFGELKVSSSPLRNEILLKLPAECSFSSIE